MLPKFYLPSHIVPKKRRVKSSSSIPKSLPLTSSVSYHPHPTAASHLPSFQLHRHRLLRVVLHVHAEADEVLSLRVHVVRQGARQMGAAVEVETTHLRQGVREGQPHLKCGGTIWKNGDLSDWTHKDYERLWFKHYENLELTNNHGYVILCHVMSPKDTKFIWGGLRTCSGNLVVLPLIQFWEVGVSESSSRQLIWGLHHDIS